MPHHHPSPRLVSTALIVSVVGLVALSPRTLAQDSAPPADSKPAQVPAAPAAPTRPPGVIWAKINPREQQVVTTLLESPDWPLRVFALLRLERYLGDEVEEMIRGRLADSAWQVRCFALREAYQLGYEVDPEVLTGETEPFVVRAALRTGIALDEELVTRGTKKLMRTRDLEPLLLGLEIAAASDIEPLRSEARKRVIRLIDNMNNSVSTRIARRLANVIGSTTTSGDSAVWRNWLKGNRKTFTLAPPFALNPTPIAPRTEVASMDAETFSRLLDYLDFLRQRDLEVAIVMDFTSSMLPMINQARAGVDALILFMNDISRTMRLGFVAYRDHDNHPVFQRHPFTDDVKSVRDFLFNLEVSGGRDFPEAVLDGMTACTGLEWSKTASRQIILVGDAPPHEEDMYKLLNLVDAFRNEEILVHAVHVPLEEAGVQLPPSWYHFNELAAVAFTDIAYRGGGRMVKLNTAEQLVPAVMHFTLEEGWWPVFDEFYAHYLDICR